MNLRGLRRLAGQAITMSGTSQKSSAAPAGTRAVHIGCAAQPGYILIGTEPVANNAVILVPANDSIVLDCGAGEKVAVLQAGTAGSISINFLG